MTTLRIGAQRHRAVYTINEAASEARSRHLTVGMGQDIVYTVKLAQAEAYISAYAADSAAPVPAYVAADVAAVGGTALAAAEAIVAASNVFHAGPGPDIEQARRAGKAAVMAADSPEAVASALAEAIDALATI